MKNFIELTVVEYPNYGYYNGENEPVFRKQIFNISVIERISSISDRRYKDVNSSLRITNASSMVQCKETYNEIKKLLEI